MKLNIGKPFSILYNAFPTISRITNRKVKVNSMNEAISILGLLSLAIIKINVVIPGTKKQILLRRIDDLE